jgi:glycine/D-amino acid oxidase-like deaminating enzyme
MLSFWETLHFTNYQYIVIGSGIVGLSTAISIAEKNPKASIAVLERGLFPTGASTRNAGFACFGSLTELLSDSENMPHQQMLDLVNERWQGLTQLRQRLGDEAMAYEGLGGYEMITEKELPALHRLEEVNQWLMPVFHKPVFERKDELISKFGFNSKSVKALIFNRFEGQIDTGKMMKSLLKLAQQKGIDILTGCEVVTWNDDRAEVEVIIKDQFRNETVALKTQKLIVCTNAFTAKLLPKINLKAGRGQVFVTKPLKNISFKGAFHYDEGYFYFRNLGEDRILLGGGRNLDFEGESTTEMQTTTKIINALKKLLQDVIAPNLDFEIEQEWAGIMAFGEVKVPIIEFVSPNVLLGVRCGGMGVAIGTRVGERLASLIF